jgi:hypothetical protein
MALPLFALLAAVGCGAADRPIPVRGKVTFQGQPVGEGVVQFNHTATGHAVEAELTSAGGYEALLKPGGYTVVVMPPVVKVGFDTPNVIPDVQVKKVKNIPDRYHSTATSKLSADVGPDRSGHDFDLKP